MVRPERVELPTYWFVASRSIQLSYGRTDGFKRNHKQNISIFPAAQSLSERAKPLVGDFGRR